MKDLDQYYKILELDPGASQEQIKQAYRDLARVWHPDRFSHDARLQEKAQEKMKEINEAYEQLQNQFKSTYINNAKTKYQKPNDESESTSYSPNSSKFKTNYWTKLTPGIIVIIIIFVLQQLNNSDHKSIPVQDNFYGNKSEENVSVNPSTPDVSQSKLTSQKKDQDENILETVVIGSQKWMKKNLNVEHYRNGDPIPQVQDNNKWKELETGAWCYYDNNLEYGKKYGKLYNWYAVNDKRGLAPEGWHIPTIDEFNLLTTIVNNDGNGLKAIRQGVGNGVGTNSSEFSALLSGGRYESFYGLGYNTYFWSSTEPHSTLANYMILFYNTDGIYFPNDGKKAGFSVRCLKD